MTEETKNAYYVVGALSAAFVLLCVLMSGCGTVTCTQGVKFISTAWSVGNCIFSCVKDNVTVASTEEPASNGVKTTNKFVVGNQTTGYDVELAKDKEVK
jgi:hypothetical protein